MTSLALLAIAVSLAGAQAMVGTLTSVEWNPAGHEKTCHWRFEETGMDLALTLPAAQDCPETVTEDDIRNGRFGTSRESVRATEEVGPIGENSSRNLAECVPGYVEVLVVRDADGAVSRTEIVSVTPGSYEDLARWLVAATDFPTGAPDIEEIATIDFQNPACD